jgi:hypothetical protein
VTPTLTSMSVGPNRASPRTCGTAKLHGPQWQRLSPLSPGRDLLHGSTEALSLTMAPRFTGRAFGVLATREADSLHLQR